MLVGINNLEDWLWFFGGKALSATKIIKNSDCVIDGGNSVLVSS